MSKQSWELAGSHIFLSEFMYRFKVMDWVVTSPKTATRESMKELFDQIILPKLERRIKFDPRTRAIEYFFEVWLEDNYPEEK